MRTRVLARFALVAALACAPTLASAQTKALPSADAAPFLGTWVVTLPTPQGNLEQTVSLKDANGKVLGDISSNMQPGSQPIDEISKSGNDLVLKFQGDFQGTAFQAAITMTLDGADKANCTFDVMNGQFVIQGTAVKK